MRSTLMVTVFVVGLAGWSSALAKDPPPPDVKCGTPEWAVFKDAAQKFCAAQKKKTEACKYVVEEMGRCGAKVIEGKKVAKGRFDYNAGGDNPGECAMARFMKDKSGWKVTKVWAADCPSGMTD